MAKEVRKVTTNWFPNREDGWRPGGAQAARVELLRQAKIGAWRKAVDQWMLYSVCSGFGGMVPQHCVDELNQALADAETAEMIWQEALQENS